MNFICNFFRFLCCKTKMETNLYEDYSSDESYNACDKEFDKSSSLRQKHAKFYSSIPKINRRTETPPERCVS